jgi:hypothetical protein
LIGVLEQGQHAVANQVDRGLVAGNEQKHNRADKLSAVQTIALVLGVD